MQLPVTKGDGLLAIGLEFATSASVGSTDVALALFGANEFTPANRMRGAFVKDQLAGIK